MMIRVAGGLIIASLLAVGAAAPASAQADADGLLHAPDAFRAAVRCVRPAIVTIETVGGVNVASSPTQREKIGGLARPGEGPTTGLVLTEDGYIITSTYNFIRKPPVVTVTLHDGSQHVAKMLGRDMTRNLTLLKIDPPEGLTPPRFAEPDAWRVGQWAISVGMGYGGGAPAVSVGIISALGRIGGRAVQTDANLSPANYGGPLIDLHGRVIGVCVPLTPRGDSPAAGSQWYDSGIGFAVPVQNLPHIVARLKAGQTLRRGYIGIVPAPEPVADGGVKVQVIAPHSPSSRAGLEPGDVITHIEGQAVDTPGAVLRVLGRYVAGDTVDVDVRRDEATRVVELTLRTAPFEPEDGDADAKDPPEPAGADPNDDGAAGGE